MSEKHNVVISPGERIRELEADLHAAIMREKAISQENARLNSENDELREQNKFLKEKVAVHREDVAAVEDHMGERYGRERRLSDHLMTYIMELEERVR